MYIFRDLCARYKSDCLSGRVYLLQVSQERNQLLPVDWMHRLGRWCGLVSVFSDFVSLTVLEPNRHLMNCTLR